MDRLTDEQVIELWEERAAIIEFDGKQPRRDAERRAYAQIKRQHRPNEKMPDATSGWLKKV